LESIDVVRWLVFLEIVRVPAFVHALVNIPEVNEGLSVIRALEDQIIDER